MKAAVVTFLLKFLFFLGIDLKDKYFMIIEWQVLALVLGNKSVCCNLWISICGRNNPIQVFYFGCCGLLSGIKWFLVDGQEESYSNLCSEDGR